MEEKNYSKISLSTLLLLLAIIVIVVMGCFIYKLYKDKQSANIQISELNNEVLTLENIVNKLKTTTEESSDLNNYIFELNSKNKYTIITDMRWKTMLNDGGSNTSIYYQIDFDNNIVSKIQEDFQANLGSSSNTEKSIIYIKKIDSNIKEDAESLLEEIITKEDINETHNYKYFTILNLNAEKNIYNSNTIENINNLLEKMDESKK